MTDSPSDDAWNNFVMRSQPDDYELGSSKRLAAIAKMYMGQANRGGINSFLTNAWELDATEVLEALQSIGAVTAAKEFAYVLSELGAPIPSSSQDVRWRLLEQRWSDALNEHDLLSDEADKELMRTLGQHVLEHEDFYLKLE